MTHLQSLADKKGIIDILAVIIVVTALGLAITSVWNDAPIVDEIPHIGAGYSYIAKGDHRLNPEHPPLAKDLAGISLKLYGIKDRAAFDDKSWQTDLNGQWEFGRKLIFNSGNDAIWVTRFAKLPILIFFIISAIIIFIWTRQIASYFAALMALFLFAFSPTVLAHARFVTTDVPALFGVLLSSYFFVHYLKNQNRKNLILAGIALGIAELTKFSLFLLIPFFLGLALIYAFLNSPKSKFFNSLSLICNSILIIAIGYIFVVWPVYYFHTWNYPAELQQSQTTTLLQSYGNRNFADPVIYLSGKPVVRALAEYGLGLLMVTQRAVGGNTTYFLGEVSKESWPHYFPIVYFLKEPLPFWGMIMIVMLIGAARFKFYNLKSQMRHCIDWSKNHFAELTMLLWIFGYWYTSIRANLNIGVRHLMPVYGFTFILLAGALVKIASSLDRKKLFTFYFLLFTLMGWYLYENISVYPYYLTYFNQVAGGPSGGYRYVVDSNLDWGQDLKRLADWVKEKDIKKISLDYFGWSDQTYYIKDGLVWIRAGQYINADNFLKDNPEGGYIAVSASFFMGSREKPETSYAWLDDYKPITIIGNSIFVWYISPR
ncbi:MAG: phospholipid carrier-dependent glycosyltransferase [bacterium]|nr:phospholipid carrier-dependent glycosyltransferase [bacterium]MDO8496429.1 phospholipid carrier-dependent glycosyltransferase [bacterium]